MVIFFFLFIIVPPSNSNLLLLSVSSQDWNFGYIVALSVQTLVHLPSLSSMLLLRNISNFSHYSGLSAMSLSNLNRSNSKVFRHILPCVAPVCEGMHYHKTGVPWQMKSTFIIVIYPHLIIYFVPLPFPSTAITPFSSIDFNNCVVFDLPNGTYGAISLIGFSIVLLKDL